MRWNTGGQRWSPGGKEGRTALHSLFSPERAEHPASQNNSYSGQTCSVQIHYNNYIPLLGLIGFQLHIFYQNYSEENCYRKKCWEISLLKQKATFHCASLGFLLDWNVNNLTIKLLLIGFQPFHFHKSSEYSIESHYLWSAQSNTNWIMYNLWETQNPGSRRCMFSFSHDLRTDVKLPRLIHKYICIVFKIEGGKQRWR